MPQNKFSTYVYHPGDDVVDELAVPEGTHVNDFHDWLQKNGYHDPEPTREGALENTEAFRKAALKSSMLAATGEIRLRSGSGEGGEAGFVIRKDGTVGPVTFQSDESSEASGHLKQKIGPEDFATFHTHDSRHLSTPSRDDIEIAKRTHHPVYVASRDGLFMVNPTDGKITQVYNRSDWEMPAKSKSGGK